QSSSSIALAMGSVTLGLVKGPVWGWLSVATVAASWPASDKRGLRAQQQEPPCPSGGACPRVSD
ncbi:hypothetical protein, partial [Citrobacter freundii]|uniref:hypothetical protein n=1 Tax=Citrobacter freundii TaxID=546 RepID=UPI001952F40F